MPVAHLDPQRRALPLQLPLDTGHRHVTVNYLKRILTQTQAARQDMLKRFFVLMVVSSAFLTTGCIALVVGAGAGAGAFAYVDGELSRTYEAKYEKIYQICISILKDLKQPVLEETTDGIQTTIESKRSDDTPMTIKVRIIDPDWTEVSVRTGVLGVWKKEISEQFHEFIAERLKR
jgi:hypothetical protein